MQAVVPGLPPARFSIVGRFWDCQLYSGDLYLFDVEGALHKVEWEPLVRSLRIPAELEMVSGAAFWGSSDFYSPAVRRVIQDPEIQPIIADKFRRLASLTRDWSVNINALSRSTDNPFPFPHSDSDVHYGSLYVGSRSGVYEASANSIYSRGKRAQRLFDVPSLDIATKHATIAVAGGSDGLFEIRRQDRHYLPSLVAPNLCNTCEWSYASIVGSDHAQSLFVAAFSRVREASDNRRSRKKVRQFDRVIASEELFTGNIGSRSHIEWGAKDRLYRYVDGHFDVLCNNSNGAVSFARLEGQQIEFRFDLDTFVAVRVAPFGSVLEFDDGILVLLNSGELLEFPGEPVNWRVYPRSMNYLNHLHLIYEDRMEVVAFTSDYLTPPDRRRFGTEPISIDDHFG